MKVDMTEREFRDLMAVLTLGMVDYEMRKQLMEGYAKAMLQRLIDEKIGLAPPKSTPFAKKGSP